jgi:hypothetical protein
VSGVCNSTPLISASPAPIGGQGGGAFGERHPHALANNFSRLLSIKNNFLAGKNIGYLGKGAFPFCMVGQNLSMTAVSSMQAIILTCPAQRWQVSIYIYKEIHAGGSVT